MKVEGCFYRINVGSRTYKVYAIDLRYSKKIRKVKTPPLPNVWDDDEMTGNFRKESIE